MKSVLSIIQRFFFEKKSNADLAVVRVLFYLYIFYCLLFQMSNWPLFAGHSPLFYEANGMFKFFKISVDGYFVLYYGAIIASLLSAFGLLGRWPVIAAFICFSFINSLPQFYSTLVALNSANTFILFVFCFTDAHRHYSLSALVKRKFETPIFNAEFGWPIFYFRLIHVNFIFMSGFTKIWETGPIGS